MKLLFFFPWVVPALCMFFLACCAESKNSENTPAAESTATVPVIPEDAVKFDFTRHMYFDVVIGDSISSRLVLDTGNTNLLLDSAYYKETFGSSRVPLRALVSGAGEELEMAVIDKNTWNYSVGTNSATEDIAVILDLRRILGEGVDGLFGMNFLKGRMVEFSYDDGYIRFLPLDFIPEDDFKHISCDFSGNDSMRILMPLTLCIDENTVIDGKFLVDTGAGGSIILNSGISRRYSLKEKLPHAVESYSDNGGVGGGRTDYVFDARSVEVAGMKIEKMSMAFSLAEQGALANTHYDGIVGNAFLKHFDIIINFHTGDMYLRPSALFPSL